MGQVLDRLRASAARAVADWSVTAAGLAGAGLFSFGAGLAWLPAGFMTAGGFLLVGAGLTASAQARAGSAAAIAAAHAERMARGE